MKYTPQHIRKTLMNTISEIANNPKVFAKNPEKDFVRTRKLPFAKMLKAVLSMTAKDLKCELMDIFGFTEKLPTVSAFVQQRNKISLLAFETLFKNFTSSFSAPKLFKGYRLFAVDGTDLHTPTNRAETGSFHPGTNGQKPYNLLHLNVFYDLMNKIYTDAVIQGKNNTNEHKAFVSMIDRDTSVYPTVYIADRGFEAYNNLAHIQEKGQYFLIRIKDVTSGGIAKRFLLPTTGEFDISLSLNLTRKQTNAVKADKSLAYLPHNVNFDFLPSHSSKHTPIEVYSLNLRFVRIMLSEGKFELLITNLKPEEFSSSDLKQLYSFRWGIETSFRALKYSLGLIFFHSKKEEYISQEIFAKLTVYNFTELITSHIVIRKKKRKYPFKVNFSASVHICRSFLSGNISPSSVEALISKYVVPVRPSASNPRKLNSKTAVCFLYRIA